MSEYENYKITKCTHCKMLINAFEGNGNEALCSTCNQVSQYDYDDDLVYEHYNTHEIQYSIKEKEENEILLKFKSQLRLNRQCMEEIANLIYILKNNEKYKETTMMKEEYYAFIVYAGCRRCQQPVDFSDVASIISFSNHQFLKKFQSFIMKFDIMVPPMSLKISVRNLGEKLCGFYENITENEKGHKKNKKEKIMSNSLKLSDFIESIGVNYFRKHSTLAALILYCVCYHYAYDHLNSIMLFLQKAANLTEYSFDHKIKEFLNIILVNCQPYPGFFCLNEKNILLHLPDICRIHKKISDLYQKIKNNDAKSITAANVEKVDLYEQVMAKDDINTDYYNLKLSINTAQKMVSNNTEMSYLDNFLMSEETNYFEKFQKQDCVIEVSEKFNKSNKANKTKYQIFQQNRKERLNNCFQNFIKKYNEERRENGLNSILNLHETKEVIKCGKKGYMRSLPIKPVDEQEKNQNLNDYGNKKLIKQCKRAFKEPNLSKLAKKLKFEDQSEIDESHLSIDEEGNDESYISENISDLKDVEVECYFKNEHETLLKNFND